MRIHAITCPQCGATLPVHEGDTFAICTHCATRCAIEYDAAAARASAPTRFLDPSTGYTVITATIPAGWRAQGAIQANNVMDNWVTITGSATSANGYEKILYESMCTYRMYENDPHTGWDGPQYSAQAGRLFWRYHKADEYADVVVSQITGGAPATLEKRIPVPGKLGKIWRSPEAYQTMLRLEQQAADQFNRATQGVASLTLLGLEITTALSLYRVASPAGERGVVIATIVKAIRAHRKTNLNFMMGGAGLLAGALGGLLGGIGQNGRQGGQPFSDEGVYIEWKPTYYALLTEWPVAPASLAKFSTFADSVDIDPCVLQVAKQYSDRFQAQLNAMTRQNNERWERVSQFARQQSADLDRWRADNWNRMQEHDRQMAQIRGISSTPSAAGTGETLDDRIQRLRHEAIMDVNTYDREDGTTVEFSTQADRVFESDLDHTVHVGTEHYYDDYVPDGWTELHQRP